MSSWKIIPTIVLATVLIFGAGVFTGGFLVNSVKPSRPKKSAPRVELLGTNSAANSVVAASTNAAGAPNTKSLRPPEILSKQFVQQLDDALHLKPEQHDAIHKIINEGQNLMRKVVQDSRLEIREVLTAEQRAQFDELVKRPFRKPVFSTNGVSTLPESSLKTRPGSNAERLPNGSSPAPANAP